jgi:hypothetical protein
VARRLLVAFPIVALLLVAAVASRIAAARPERAWVCALLPVVALLIGPRTRLVVVAALIELAAVVPLHAAITLFRAIRLEGG